MTITRATGLTFPHRETLHRLRGKWDGVARAWVFYDLAPAQLETLRGLFGVFVTTDGPARDPVRDAMRAIDRAYGAPPPPPRQPTVVIGDDPRYLNYFADKNPTAFFGFSTLGAFVDYVASLDEPDDPKRSTGWQTKKADWAGTPDMSAALAVARQGWADGMALGDRVTMPPALRKRRTASVAGGTVNVGRLLAGNPRHMTRRVKIEGRRTVTLFVDAACIAAIGVETMVVRAFLIVAIIDMLETYGYNCEIISVFCTTGDDYDPGAQFAVTVKHAGERLNLLDISFALGHPSFLRRLAFACVDTCDACTTTHYTQGDHSDAFDDNNPCGRNEFYIPTLTSAGQNALIANGPMAMLPYIEPDGLPVSLKDAG